MHFNLYFACVCVCVHACAHVHVCVRTYVCACERESIWTFCVYMGNGVTVWNISRWEWQQREHCRGRKQSKAKQRRRATLKLSRPALTRPVSLTTAQITFGQPSACLRRCHRRQFAVTCRRGDSQTRRGTRLRLDRPSCLLLPRTLYHHTSVKAHKQQQKATV